MERTGLWAGRLPGRELGEINRGRGRKRLEGGNREHRTRQRRSGENICYNLLGAREVDKVAGKLQDEGQLPLLLGQPGRRNPEQSLCERLVDSK